MFEVEDARRVGLMSLVGMGGLDAAKISPLLPSRDRIAEACARGGSTMFGSGISPG